jgi:hypothetical protein
MGELSRVWSDHMGDLQGFSQGTQKQLTKIASWQSYKHTSFLVELPAGPQAPHTAPALIPAPGPALAQLQQHPGQHGICPAWPLGGI